MKRMFTSYAGRDRFNFGEGFWGWDEDFEDSHLILEVEDGAMKKTILVFTLSQI